MKLFLKIILSTIIFINSSNAEIVEVFKFTDEEFKTLEVRKVKMLFNNNFIT